MLHYNINVTKSSSLYSIDDDLSILNLEGEKMTNTDIRLKAKENGVPLWKIADKLNISEPTMTRKLRKELSDEEKTKIIGIIAELKGEN